MNFFFSKNEKNPFVCFGSEVTAQQKNHSPCLEVQDSCPQRVLSGFSLWQHAPKTGPRGYRKQILSGDIEEERKDNNKALENTTDEKQKGERGQTCAGPIKSHLNIQENFAKLQTQARRNRGNRARHQGWVETEFNYGALI